ncbi:MULTISPECIES: hypothetical protein [unclassified Sedimentibacter]|uniref:hypothetical protein n=1 Tax=unclassified Sedimentibacter TaxID=2649220 RepID=UPI0027E0CEE8|nr:hypothetical protein [Sedimentibacter sp. MB35-C1]WMJ76822.1 hypothetical protein RBQ61_14770 [Sedimentibacter sp. MB35-C1]
METFQYLDAIETKLQNSFDICRNYKINDLKYDLFAEYHLRSERYIAVKKAIVYAFENNEYCLIKCYKELNSDICNTFVNSLKDSIESIVNPSNEHMSSAITGVMVTEKIHEENLEHIRKKIEQFKYNKGFAFGFKGWADIRLILVSLNEGLIITNKKGKEVMEVYSF